MLEPTDPTLSRTANGLAHLDDLLQHRTRLGACVLLSTAEALSFSRLRELLNETDGNLGANMKKLEEAGYVNADKRFVDRKPLTTYTLTAPGKKSLKSHLAALQAVIGTAPA
jgi:DNA-binding MarR family transcriptional regulator